MYIYMLLLICNLIEVFFIVCKRNFNPGCLLPLPLARLPLPLPPARLLLPLPPVHLPLPDLS